MGTIAAHSKNCYKETMNKEITDIIQKKIPEIEAVNMFDPKKKLKQEKLEEAFVKILDYVENTRGS